MKADSMLEKCRVGLPWLMVLVLAGCASHGPAPVSDRGGAPDRSAAPPAGPHPGYYVVQPGDTLLGISRRVGVALQDLVIWNGLTSTNQIVAGQELRIVPPDGAAQVRPIQPPEGAEVRPVTPGGAPVGAPPYKDGPRGGRVPYTDQAWNQAQAADRGAAPATPPEAPKETPPAVPAASSDWIWPAEGKVISGFGDGNGKGIDIAGKAGDPVLATAGGKVVYAGSGLRGYGKLVIIKHDDSFLSAYAHNRLLLVNEGQAVTKGQKIAELGNTDSDRPKLHFEIRRQGKPVDPMKYLPSR